MKKFLVLFTLIVMLSGCSGSTSSYPNSFFYVDDCLISYIVENEQMILRTDVIPTDITKSNICVYSLNEMLSSDSDVDAIFVDYSGQEILKTVSASGNWNPFPVKVTYKRYNIDNQPQKTEWIDYFSTQLARVTENTPLIITQSWSFDWNGKNITTVTAANAFQNYEDSTILYNETNPSTVSNPPKKSDTIAYSMTAIFVDGVPAKPNDIHFTTIENEPISKDVIISYVPADEGYYQQYFYTYQYDENGDLAVSPIFTGHTGEQILWESCTQSAIVVADTDGDNIPELLILDPTHLNPTLVVYDIENGKVNDLYSLSKMLWTK